MSQIYKSYYPSEIGLLEIIGTAESIRAIEFVDKEEGDQAIEPADPPPAVAACLAQLDEYFKGERRNFSLNLKPDGTAFQQAVWQQLTAIPYGQTTSYLDIARQVGNEKAVRAVGAANGQNPIVIVVPCHRVVGSNGQLTGYGGGLWRKAWLLEHEKRFSSPQMALF
ncbi:MAG: methylated-DNA--[protein]-cysteine S-methyltransferase [Anaerolineae bacterium]|nr:methylated-DNA--[protein]-cysteine S-methyltransferase [Anaerolineales bacterium]